MKIIKTTKRVGELVGPVDWDFDFKSFDWKDGHGGMNPIVSKRAVEMLCQLDARPEGWEATTDGGSPRIGWGKVLAIGMYDGWPHWRPVPSVCIATHMGSEWHSFYSLTGIRRAKNP